MPKKENPNEHPKKPPVSVQDALKQPYYEEKNWQTKMLSQKIYRPADDGKPDFYGKVKGVTTFSDKGFFKTVFSGGDDMVAEMQAIKKKEAEDWKAKVVVKNTHFTVNTVIPKSE